MTNDTQDGPKPVRGNAHDWGAHTPRNAAEVLSEEGYGKAPSFRARLEQNPERPYLVNAINPGGSLKVGPDEPLRQVLAHISKTHRVEVLVPGDRGFVPWTGATHDPGLILTIRISARANAQAA